MATVVGWFGPAGRALGAAEESRPVSKLWTQFVEARRTGATPILADFSCAGYQRGEAPIPDAVWKIFDVTSFGAVPNDAISDRPALLQAIHAAEENGSGIIFFPPGRYRLNEESDPPNTPIDIRGSRIVLRGSGSGSGGTEIFMSRPMEAAQPAQIWTSPYLLRFQGRGVAGRPVRVAADSPREGHEVEVANASAFRPGDWVCLRVRDRSPEGITEAVAPHAADPRWTNLVRDGVAIDEFHCIERVVGRRLRFKEPIHADVKAGRGWTVVEFHPLVEAGVEDIAFVGNWHEPFVHHKNAIHDGGWSLLSLNSCANGWVRRCRFTDSNRPLTSAGSSGLTIEDIVIDGNPGHHAVALNGTCHSLVRRVQMLTAQWHAGGVAGTSSGNVFLDCRYPPDTCYESHASQPRWTLFDNVSGGWLYGRWGGALSNQPNHLRGLVLWNYENTGTGEPEPFHFMRPERDSEYGRAIMPFVIGFHGAKQAWVESEIEVLESNGTPVEPRSLYEAQLDLRSHTPGSPR